MHRGVLITCPAFAHLYIFHPISQAIRTFHARIHPFLIINGHLFTLLILHWLSSIILSEFIFKVFFPLNHHFHLQLLLSKFNSST